jgi:DNA-binding LacI/PurR family transcriptional regulator
VTTTVREIAKRARVSVGTVSNVLNHRATVKPAVRALVEAAIADLGYPAHGRAAGRTQTATPAISFLLSNRELFDPFHSRVLEGVASECEGAGALVHFFKLQYEPGLDVERIPLHPALRSRSIPGCVVLSGVNYPNLLRALTELDFSYVLMANNLVSQQAREPLDQVRFDDVRAAREATIYLIEMGHKDIWFVGDVSFPWFNNRYDGYLAAMAEFGLKPRAQKAGISDDRFINGFRCMAAILKDKQPVTAIFAATDEIAYGCWECLQQSSISVPDQVSLLGFDDQRGPFKGVGLSTVRVEAEVIGHHLASMALEKNKTSSPCSIPEVVIPTKLVKRGTCQPPRPK